jgi:hypothetical protein
MSVRGKRDQGYRFGKGFLGRGLISSSGPKGFPEALFLIFFSFLLFLFLFSHFFCIFYKNASNQFKPLSKISKNQWSDLKLQEN